MSSSRTGSSSDHPHSSKKPRETAQKPKPPLDEHDALCQATEAVLRKILTSDEHLSYLPPDCTLEELQAEIALAKGLATIVYVKRDGLRTLKVVLPQQNPTIANLKRGIERTANLLEQRKSKSKSKNLTSDRAKATETKSSTDTPPRRSGDLVEAASTRSNRPHRINVSWRFLWRAYALCKAHDIEEAVANPIPDEDGRQLLSDFGIGHKSVLRFVKREKYFGRRRQRS